MRIFDFIAASPENLGKLLSSLPVATGPWDEAFHRAFCDGCKAENCDAENCPHDKERNNPTWWLMQEAEGEQETSKTVSASEREQLICRYESMVRQCEQRLAKLKAGASPGQVVSRAVFRDRRLVLEPGVTVWEAAVDIIRRSYTSGTPIRSLSVKASGLVPADEMDQMSLFPEIRREQRQADIDHAIDRIRAKYGYFSIRRAITLIDPTLDLDAKGSHIIHPVGFLGTLSETAP